jgi:Flp pilus assembly protein TadG
MKNKSFARPQLDSGQSLVEFALTLPLLILVIMGVFDLGWGIYAKNTIADAAREGARAGIITTNTDSVIRTRVRNAAQGLNLTNAQIVISPSPTRTHGGTIQVTINYTYQPLTSFIVGGVSVPLSSRATMVVE